MKTPKLVIAREVVVQATTIGAGFLVRRAIGTHVPFHPNIAIRLCENLAAIGIGGTIAKAASKNIGESFDSIVQTIKDAPKN